MAVDWILNQRKKTASYANNVDSKAALLAIANKHSTHPLAVDTRRKTIELRTATPITFHWIKGHTGLKGNETADYLAKNSSALQTHHHHLRQTTSVQREAVTGRLLHKNLECNIY